MTYSKTLYKIEQAHKLYKTGYKPKEIAAKLKTPRPTIYRWLKVTDNIEIKKYHNGLFDHIQFPIENHSDNFHYNNQDKTIIRKNINSKVINDDLKNDKIFDDRLSCFRIKTIKLTLLFFCIICTAFIIWESGKLQNSLESMILSALIETGAVILAAAPLQGKQRYVKIALLSLISIYSITLLCTSLLSKDEAERFKYTHAQKNDELKRDILKKKNDNINKMINILSDEIESKKNDLNGYLQSGYITVSKKLSNEIRELEDKVINLNAQLSSEIKSLEHNLIPINFHATILLCVGRALLVLLNFMAATYYHKVNRYIVIKNKKSH